MISEAQIVTALEGAALKTMCPWHSLWSARARRLRRCIRAQSIHRMMLISTISSWVHEIEKREEHSMMQARALATARKRSRGTAWHRLKRWFKEKILRRKPESALVEQALEDAARRRSGGAVS